MNFFYIGRYKLKAKYTLILHEKESIRDKDNL